MGGSSNKVHRFLLEIDEAYERVVPAAVMARAKESLLDYIGVSYAGRKALAGKRDGLTLLCDGGRFPVIGEAGAYSLKDAVFLNGLYAHALDFDDGVNEGIIHLGSPIFSVLMPLAFDSDATGEKLLKSAIIGYETAWTLAESIQPDHKLRGFHATGTCGMLGAVVAASYMLDMSEQERYRAFSTALCSATGTLKVLEDGSELKPYNVAKAALLAVASLQMAKAGFEVPEDALSGKRGFLAMATGDGNRRIDHPLKDGRYAIMRTYTKPYAACRYCHPSIEAAVKIGASIGRDDSHIEGIAVRTYDLAVFKHDHTEILGEGSAKMSIPYGVAVGLLKGKAGLSEYSAEAVRDERVLDLARKVAVSSDEAMSAAFPAETIAEVSVRLSTGEVVAETVSHPKGEPENPLGHDGVCGKFREMVGWAGMDGAFAGEVIASVFEVEDGLPHLFELMKAGIE